MVRTSRSLITPAANSAATLGSRSRNATPRWVWDNANPWLIPPAAPISAATAASGSTHQLSRSSAFVRPVRRQNSSAIAASFTAHAAFSARVTPPIASTKAASLSDDRSEISGSKASNMHSNLLPTADRNTSSTPTLWMNFQLWITKSADAEDPVLDDPCRGADSNSR